MPEDKNKDSESRQFKFSKEEIIMPDLAEVWKEVYYSTEKAWADAFKDFVSTETFVNMLDKTLEQYLAYEKMSRESVDKYCEINPMASKKDIARVAELVVSMEDKLDDMEFQLFDNVRVMADNMLKIVTIQDSFRGGLENLITQVNGLHERMSRLDQRLEGLDGKISASTDQGFSRVSSEMDRLLQNNDDSYTAMTESVNNRLDALLKAVEELAGLDLDKSSKKLDLLEKKIEQLTKELKVQQKGKSGEASAPKSSEKTGQQD